MGKRKVATDNSNKQDKTKKILKCLSYRPEGANPKTISRETGINVNTVKTLLPQIPQIHKPMRGIYKVVNEGDGNQQNPVLNDLRSWNFHNCILSAPCDQDIVEEHNYDLVTMSVTAVNGKATCRLATDYPLNVSSLCFVAGYFMEIVSCKWEDVIISSVEFNKDYRNIRLDGLNSLAIDSLASQFKLYQKSLGLRIEHKTKVAFTMDSIVSMLSQNPMSLDTLVKIDKLSEHVQNLTDTMKTHQAALIKLATQSASARSEYINETQ